MKKKRMRLISICMTLTILFGAAMRVPAAAPEQSDGSVPMANSVSNENTPDEDAPQDTVPAFNPDSTPSDETQKEPEVPKDENTTKEPENSDASGSTTAPDAVPSEPQTPQTPQTPPENSENSGNNTTEDKGTDNISGSITTDGNEDISGKITVEQDKNDDNVEIKKNDKPYLALGADLTAEQRATVLAIMGIDSGKLSDYDVVSVNNAEEHQYLDSYIEKSKIGSKSLSSIVIVERKDGSGINISTNNITYCTVGMYKNALATAGIQNADIIVAAPFPISGTAALVGVFKAYTQMTGDTIDEENIDAALNELVVTGQLEAGGAGSDEVEGMIAYVKQAVVEHDLSNESEIRDAIAEGCEKFDITLTEEEINEIVKLMQKIGELDLDLDGLLNAAQSIYDKIATADGGFWAKIRELLRTIWIKIKELF